MLEIRKILAPVDFSKRSRAAVSHAGALAKTFGAELALLHVTASDQSKRPFWSDRLYEEIEAAHAQELQQIEAELRKFADETAPRANVSIAIVEGDPADQIEEYVERENIDLIVISTLGRGRFREFLMGSLTLRLLHDLGCPILTGVHLEDTPDFPETVAGNVGCAIELSDEENAERVLRWAAGYAAKISGKLVVVHVCYSIESALAKGMGEEPLEAVRTEAGQRIRAILDRIGCEAEIVIRAGGPVAKITEAVKEKKCNALVIGRGGRKRIFSVGDASGYALVRSSPCPVFSV
jgi:nucleotide-binding universal stress UspA family protein